MSPKCSCNPQMGDEIWIRARVVECGEGDDCVEVWVDDKFHEEDTNVLIPKRDILWDEVTHKPVVPK